MSIESDLILALRNNYRFDSTKGPRTVEDLFSLTGLQINSMYENLAAEEASHPTRSLMSSSVRKAEVTELQTKLNILEYIFNLKKDEAKQTADKTTARKALQVRLQELEERKTGAVKSMTTEELAKEIESLKAILDS